MSAAEQLAQLLEVVQETCDVGGRLPLSSEDGAQLAKLTKVFAERLQAVQALVLSQTRVEEEVPMLNNSYAEAERLEVGV